MKSDLHVHSSYSDGDHDVKWLVENAVKNDVYAFALTDHDTVDGIADLVKYGKEYNQKVISGIEISSIKKGDVHILGLGIDANSPYLKNKLCEIIQKRKQRNEIILQKLSAFGLKIDYSYLEERGKNKTIGKKLIADIMVENGLVKSISEAFDKFLSVGRPCYVPLDKLSPFDAVETVLKSGGLPVLAHPTKLGFDGTERERFISELKECGLWGIESYYYSHTPGEVAYFENLAKENNLVNVGGSDFHGAYRDSKLGQTAKENIREVLDYLIKR